ncbi:MAG TPA: penicillin-binding protein 2 [Stellaceae bacterium]|nr:penicillin-binding protein 2 [Stellaceae bacterium]
MQRENNRTKLLTRRALLLGGAQVALLATLAGRMYYLQVVQADRYAMLSDENRINIRLLAPPRGRIVDRFGVALADNAPTYRAVLVAEQAGDIPSTLDAVATLIPVSDADRHRVLRDVKRKHSFVPVMIRENLSWEEMARVEANTLELPGVSIEQGLTRYYPFGPTASHVLGYVAAVSDKELTGDDPLLELPDFRIGKNGIEKEYDLELRGSAGTSEVEVNAYGRVVRELTREDGIPGQEIVLSLDAALQDLAAKRCSDELSSSCVLLDSWTGEVLALASSPGYDPAAFSSGLTQAMWHQLVTDPLDPLIDKAIAGVYSPGSTFKPLVAMTALEAGAITPETTFFCPGFFHLGNTVFHCWKHGGHGNIAVREAIKQSCDVFFYNVADILGIDRIAAMAHNFGLGEKLDIDIPGEKSGIIPTRAWKRALTGVAWQRGDTVSCGIGQSYVSVTPLQLATYAARLVTGRAVVPRLTRSTGIMTAASPIAQQVSGKFALLGFNPKHVDVVLNGMFGVVNEPHGTAYHARIEDPQFLMGGKTGTAQVRHITQAEREHGLRKPTDVPWKERDHALFISFAPVSAPRYVCAVVVEHGGKTAGEGGAVAAPIARDVLLEAQQRAPVLRVPDHPYAPTTSVAQG